MIRWLKRLVFLLSITESRGIARRYFVVNGFDGALTMLGLLTGFYASGGVTPTVAVSACLGAALALAASGVSGAYLSEAAERRKALRELEAAMVARLHDSAHGEAARQVPLLIALVNGLAPLLTSLLITLPLWLADAQFALPADPLVMAIGIALGVIFLLGAFLGRISHTFWLSSGLRAVSIALATGALILVIR